MVQLYYYSFVPVVDYFFVGVFMFCWVRFRIPGN